MVSFIVQNRFQFKNMSFTCGSIHNPMNDIKIVEKVDRNSQHEWYAAQYLLFYQKTCLKVVQPTSGLG